MTLTEAAVALGVTAATLRQQIAAGRLRATKRGRDWWVTRGEVARYRREVSRKRVAG
jgi:excisionase family DNA binding protein